MIPTIGAVFVNDTGTAIASLEIAMSFGHAVAVIPSVLVSGAGYDGHVGPVAWKGDTRFAAPPWCCSSPGQPPLHGPRCC